MSSYSYALFVQLLMKKVDFATMAFTCSGGAKMIHGFIQDPSFSNVNSSKGQIAGEEFIQEIDSVLRQIKEDLHTIEQLSATFQGRKYSTVPPSMQNQIKRIFEDLRNIEFKLINIKITLNRYNHVSEKIFLFEEVQGQFKNILEHNQRA